MNQVIRTTRKTVVVPSAPVGTSGGPGPPGLSNNGFATRVAMAGYAPGGGLHVGDNFFLAEAGREGAFVVDLASNWTAAIAADTAQAALVLSTFDATKVYRRILGNGLNARSSGAAGDGSANDSTNIVATVAYLKSIAVNLSVNGFYKGSPELLAPSGHYFMSTTPVDVTHTFIIEGAGGGRFMTQGGAVTRFRWANGTSGLRFQAADTSGDTTKDGTLHFGSGGCALRGVKIEGGYAGTEANYHGIVARSMIALDDVTVYGWSGNGIEAIAAQSGPYSAYGGNFSVSSIFRSRLESNRIGLNVRGSDANVLTAINTELIANRQAGYWDESGIGSNVLIGIHAASNGLDGQTQCAIGGYHYAVIVGQESGASTNPPKSSTVTITIASPGVVTWTAHGLPAGTPVAFSTTGALPTGLSPNVAYYVVSPTANTFSVAATVGGAAINTSGSQSGTHTSGAGVDNTWWYFIEPGTVTSAQRAWVTGMTWRAGGDYIVNGSPIVTLLGCYSEEQSFSQFGPNCLIINPVISARYMRGGVVVRALNGLFDVSTGAIIRGALQAYGATTVLGPQTGTSDNIVNLDNTNVESSIYFRTNGAAYGYIRSINGAGVFYEANGSSGHEFRQGAYGAEVRIASVLSGGFDLATGKVLSINGTQVVGARQTGTPADATDLATALTLINALKAKLVAHGLIS